LPSHSRAATFLLCPSTTFPISSIILTILTVASSSSSGGSSSSGCSSTAVQGVECGSVRRVACRPRWLQRGAERHLCEIELALRSIIPTAKHLRKNGC
jgi:hypothetical protein